MAASRWGSRESAPPCSACGAGICKSWSCARSMACAQAWATALNLTDQALKQAADLGWGVVSMRDDWTTVFGAV